MTLTTIDYLRLMQSLAQAAQPTDATKAIAIKQLKNILGQGEEGTVLKSSDLKSMDTLLAFLKAHNIGGEANKPAVSDVERPGDIYWKPYFIDPVGLTAYLNHLHEEIHDPVNTALLNNLVSQVNQNLELNYSKPKANGGAVQPAAKDQKPGEAKPETKPGQPTTSVDSASINAPLPLNNNYIDFKRIQGWLLAFYAAADPEYKPTARKALSELEWLTASSEGAWQPISFSQPVDAVYTNVRDMFRSKGGQAAQRAIDMPLIYLQRLSQFISDVSAAIDAFGAQFPSMQGGQLDQQRQFAQYIQVELSSWMGQIPNVQQKLDGKKP